MNDKFHQHLDTCERCRTQPFGLCPIGERLLAQEVASAARSLADRLGVDGRLGAVEDDGELKGYGHGV